MSNQVTREGSLEAPTRHPIDWQNPDFFDEEKLVAELKTRMNAGEIEPTIRNEKIVEKFRRQAAENQVKWSSLFTH